ncbi:PREDICTED: vascular endothelial growth factor B-like [Thamnophis sirtalis]|uniref:Vascular endothelial growth factor B-like n=1 Tax=Thamnophis sirtalis TaxID=35019 RepID=A0A6I9YM78_9SAUR|nr:PREDICTED: vascular endothelial growth factor B-like [Thamnophis sirtalis]
MPLRAQLPGHFFFKNKKSALFERRRIGRLLLSPGQPGSSWQQAWPWTEASFFPGKGWGDLSEAHPPPPHPALSFLTMKTLCGFLLWMAAWQLPTCSPTTMPPSEERGVELEKMLPTREVIHFLEVYNRSVCQPKEMMVSVTAEHPSLDNHIMSPSCVALRRCTGCCSDDSLDCVPSRSRDVILEVMASLFPNRYITQLSFVEHLDCTCRPRKMFYRPDSIR